MNTSLAPLSSAPISSISPFGGEEVAGEYTLSEVFTLTEANSLYANITVASSATLGLASTDSLTVVVDEALSVSLGFSANTVILAGAIYSVSENFALSSSVSSAVDLYPTVFENVTLVPGVGLVVETGVTVEETIALIAATSAVINADDILTALENLGFTSSVSFASGTEGVFASENLVLTSQVLADTIYRLSDAFSVSPNVVASLILGFAMSDEISFRTNIVYIALMLAEDGFSLSTVSTGDALKLLTASENFRLSTGSPRTTLDIVATILEVLALQDIVSAANALSASEQLTLAESATLAIKAYLSSSEVLSLVEAVTQSFTIVFEASDNIALSESAIFSANLFFSASDSIAFVGELKLGNGTFGAWVVNSETLGASQYESWPMESLAERDGRSFGLTETALFEFVGDDDDGVDIDAFIQTGFFKGGSFDEKTMPRAYLYAVSDSEMILRTFSDRRGCRTERYYSVRMVDDTVLGNRTVTLTNGRKATSWAIRVENVDGADFDLRGLEAKLVILTSRA